GNDLITGDGNDDPSNGLNDYISGVTFLTQEGVEVEACNIFAIATDINVNRLQFGGDAGAGGALTVNGVVTYGGGTALEGAVVSLMSGETEVATATTDASGAYSIAADAGVYTVMVTSVEGTATGVTSTDALAIVRDFAGIEALNGLGAAAADVNASGTTNSTDALLVAQKAVDPAVMFDAGEFISSEVNVTSGQVEADLAVVAYGDVNLSGGFEVTDEEGEGEGTTVAAKAGVTTANLVQIDGLSEATMGEAFDVPVRLSDAGTLGAFSLTFRYDAEQATFQGVSSALENVLTREIDGGVSVVWYNAAPEEALRFGTSDAFLTLNFAAAADAEGTFVLEAAGEVADNEANVIDTELLTESVEFGELPDAFALKGNYPNPFNPTTTIAFDLPEAAEVSVQVFDMLGRRVMTVPVQNLAAGASRTIQINGVALASGTYLYRLVARAETQSFVETGRMTLIK
ncbi:MAG: T9SS type A sorting domain-containing protein, partial [Bacteroidota bacterium]